MSYQRRDAMCNIVLWGLGSLAATAAIELRSYTMSEYHLCDHVSPLPSGRHGCHPTLALGYEICCALTYHASPAFVWPPWQPFNSGPETSCSVTYHASPVPSGRYGGHPTPARYSETSCAVRFHASPVPSGRHGCRPAEVRYCAAPCAVQYDASPVSSGRHGGHAIRAPVQ